MNCLDASIDPSASNIPWALSPSLVVQRVLDLCNPYNSALFSVYVCVCVYMYVCLYHHVTISYGYIFLSVLRSVTGPGLPEDTSIIYETSLLVHYYTCLMS